MLQFLIEEALLKRLQLEDALADARDHEQATAAEAIDRSLKRREQAQLALQAAG